MKSFLITFKPDSENPERGWPLAELQRLVRRHELGKRTEEKWRFHNRREVSIGDRVFLLRQGKLGPAVIGYGQVVGEPEVDDGKWKTLARFESIVDPTTHVLATKADLFGIDGGQRYWRTQASGAEYQKQLPPSLRFWWWEAR